MYAKIKGHNEEITKGDEKQFKEKKPNKKMRKKERRQQEIEVKKKKKNNNISKNHRDYKHVEKKRFKRRRRGICTTIESERETQRKNNFQSQSLSNTK